MDKKVEEELGKIIMAFNPGPHEIIFSTTLLPSADEDLFYTNKKMKELWMTSSWDHQLAWYQAYQAFRQKKLKLAIH